MRWLNIEIGQLRLPEYIGSKPTARATWINVLAYSCELECGGRLPGAGSWSDRQWQQACGVTKREVESASKLLRVENGDVVVFGYPVEKEEEVRARRESGRANVQKRWGSRPNTTPITTGIRSGKGKALPGAIRNGNEKEKGIPPIPPAGGADGGGSLNAVGVTEAFLTLLGHAGSRVFPPDDRRRWEVQIARLADACQLGYPRVREVLTWYARHANENMMPVVGQPLDVFNKWSAIERAFHKSGAWKKPTERQPPPAPPSAPADNEVQRILSEVAPKIRGRETAFRAWMVKSGCDLEIEMWDRNGGELTPSVMVAAVGFLQEHPA